MERKTTSNHPSVVLDNGDEKEGNVFSVCGPDDADLEFEIDDEEGYEDLEDDQEKMTVVSLFDDAAFDDVASMLKYVVVKYNFDLVKVQKDLKLDFLETIKLVNYIRQEVRNGRGQTIDVSTKTAFEDDHFLQPVLADDPLLYSLEDVIDGGLNLGQESTKRDTTLPEAKCRDGDLSISNLHLRVLRAQNELRAAESALSKVENADESTRGSGEEAQVQEHALYQGNYDGAELHRIMISDSIRTEAYRDFIFQNQDLFKDKVVLDVGCGTGILSLFCADAGAKQVIAVDQSRDIIGKASEIMFRNKKQDVVRVIHGKIEEIVLPVQQVDIIVSEWMGYGLLFEAMLDSVIFARDRYLRPDGLMVPKKASLHIAPFADMDYATDRLGFWDNVYGYDMSCMQKQMVQEAEVATVEDWQSVAIPQNVPFLNLDLSTVTVEDLSFSGNPFRFQISESFDRLVGFVIHFDIVFSDTIGFSTAPTCKQTHWKQIVTLIENSKEEVAIQSHKGQTLVGQIGYQKEGRGREGLDIGIEWKFDGDTDSRRQVWILR